MATPVEVPKLGNTVEECIISRWVRRIGETVSAGDVVAEIETDKTTFEVNAPVGGTVLAAFFEEGALVPVFTNLFVIGEVGESVAEFTPVAQQASEMAAPPTPISAPGSAPPLAIPTSAAPFSPRAHRFAEEHKFHPSKVNGSGPGGRVLEQDLRSLLDASGNDASGARGKASTGKGARGTIARRMRESLAITAQYTMSASANAGGLLALRARFKTSGGGPDINLNDLVAFCTIRALLQMPDLNAEFVDGTIHVHEEIHLGFACDTPRGLLVPVVRNAHALTISELAIAMKELAAQAVHGKIAPDDLSGGTFTISNLGALGIETFTPILNPPQVAILGVGAIQVKPVRRNGNVEFIDAIGLSLTCDHQVIDGAPGARFLRILQEKIEKVESECLSRSS